MERDPPRRLDDPRAAPRHHDPHSRRPVPEGLRPDRWGIPASMVGDVDKIALWNIVTTVDAYLAPASPRPKSSSPSTPRWWLRPRAPASVA